MSTKAIRIALGAILAGALLAAVYTYKKYRVAPAIAFTELEAIDALGAKGKVWRKTGRGVIVVFFASWCHDCARELPKLERVLHGPLKGADVVALTDEDLATMVKYRNLTRYNFRFYALPKDFEQYGIHAIPTFYVLNSQGEIMFTKVGDVDWNSPELIAKVKAALVPQPR
ncbi:MAG: TlpA disulfide reductase family protein [Turneriella sp.]